MRAPVAWRLSQARWSTIKVTRSPGALISLIKDGASKVVKETRSDSNGNFTTRILPGRYGIHAIAADSMK